MTGFKTMTVKIRESYGQQRIYPVCQNAHEVAGMLGTKTTCLDPHSSGAIMCTLLTR